MTALATLISDSRAFLPVMQSANDYNTTMTLIKRDSFTVLATEGLIRLRCSSGDNAISPSSTFTSAAAGRRKRIFVVGRRPTGDKSAGGLYIFKNFGGIGAWDLIQLKLMERYKYGYVGGR